MLGVDEGPVDPSSENCVNKVEIRYDFHMKEDSSALRLVSLSRLFAVLLQQWFNSLSLETSSSLSMCSDRSRTFKTESRSCQFSEGISQVRCFSP